MAHHNSNEARGDPDRMVLNLAEASIVGAESSRIRSVKLYNKIGENLFRLSDTLFMHNVSMSLLSVPELVKMNISIIFMPWKAVLIDLELLFSFLSFAM